MEFNNEKHQETTPTHLDQHIEGQNTHSKDILQQRHLKVLQSPD